MKRKLEALKSLLSKESKRLERLFACILLLFNAFLVYKSIRWPWQPPAELYDQIVVAQLAGNACGIFILYSLWQLLTNKLPKEKSLLHHLAYKVPHFCMGGFFFWPFMWASINGYAELMLKEYGNPNYVQLVIKSPEVFYHPVSMMLGIAFLLFATLGDQIGEMVLGVFSEWWKERRAAGSGGPVVVET